MGIVNVNEDDASRSSSSSSSENSSTSNSSSNTKTSAPVELTVDDIVGRDVNRPQAWSKYPQILIRIMTLSTCEDSRR